jgi:aminopeptidase N
MFKRDKDVTNTHNLKIVVPAPEEMQKIFDDICYGKGSIVCRLLAQYIGPEIFQKCLRTYLSKFEFKNATTEDLLKVMD